MEKFLDKLGTREWSFIEFKKVESKIKLNRINLF
jgi:hypothetical protein